jgi:salicylate hydroxylase
MGVEDALVLAEVLARVQEKVEGGHGNRGGLVEAALGVYNEVRYQRTQDVIHSTRQACDLFHWKDPEVSKSSEKYGQAITPLFLRVWEIDIDGMVEGALAQLDAKTA